MTAHETDQVGIAALTAGAVRVARTFDEPTPSTSKF
jgi:hypothetical protein